MGPWVQRGLGCTILVISFFVQCQLYAATDLHKPADGVHLGMERTNEGAALLCPEEKRHLRIAQITKTQRKNFAHDAV